jgi:hypothetical protein
MLRNLGLLIAVAAIVMLVGSEALAKDQDTNPADYPLVAELLFTGAPTSVSASTSTEVVEDTRPDSYRGHHPFNLGSGASETSKTKVVFKAREEIKIGKVIYTTVVMDRGHWFDETVGDSFPARLTTPRNHLNSIEILSVEKHGKNKGQPKVIHLKIVGQRVAP